MKLLIQKGTTSKSVDIFIRDSSVTTGAGLTGLVYNTSGLVCYQHRPGSAAAAVTLATLASATAAWSSGGFVVVDGTNMPGLYRLDIPDAVLATGVDQCYLMLKGAANMEPVVIEIQLVSFNPNDSVRLGLTGLANATPGAAGGLFIAGTNAPVTITGSGDALTLSSSGANGRGLAVAGNGSGAGATITGGATGASLSIVGGGTSGAGIAITTTSGDGLSILPTAGNAITATGNGASKHGIVATGGTSGTCDGFKAAAGTGGVDVRANITGNVTGNLSGTIGSLATQAKTDVEGAVLDATATSHNTAGTIGNKINSAASAGDPWATALPGAYGAGTAGNIVGNRLDAAVTTRLAPTTAGRTLDVTATGEAGIDWANIGAPTTTVNFSGTTISTSQAVASVSGAVGSVTGSVGSVAGNVTGNVSGNVTGSVGSVASGGITEASFATTAGSFAPLGIVDQGTAQAAGSTTLQLRSAAAFADDELIGATIVIATATTGAGQARTITDYVGSTDTATVDAWTTTPTGTITYKIYAGASMDAGSSAAIASAVLNATASSYNTALTIGNKINAAASAGDPWSTSLPGAYGAGTAGNILGNNLDTKVTTRLAPTVAARTLDVSATGEAGIDWANVGGQSTAVNLTSTTVSTSQQVASVSGAVGSVTGNVGGSVASVTGAVGSVTGNVGGNVVGSVGSVAGSIVGNLGGNVVGSVASVTGNVGGSVASVTGAVGSVTGNVGGNVNGNVVGSVGSVTAAVSLTASERNSTADALLDRANAIETGITPRMALRLKVAALGGKLSGAAGPTVTIRDLADTKNRIVATVDSDGNRSAVTLDLT